MRVRLSPLAMVLTLAFTVMGVLIACGLGVPPTGAAQRDGNRPAARDRSAVLPDAVEESQTPRDVPQNRSEQRKTEHDRSDVFLAAQAPPSSPAFRAQPEQGKVLGFAEALFHGKAQCAGCHPAPFFLDNRMHDLAVERFVDEPPLGPIKSFTLRGIKDSPPYLHDGRCLTLEDAVEFFNLVQGLQLSGQEKADLTAFLRAL